MPFGIDSELNDNQKYYKSEISFMNGRLFSEVKAHQMFVNTVSPSK